MSRHSRGQIVFYIILFRCSCRLPADVWETKHWSNTNIGFYKPYKCIEGFCNNICFDPLSWSSPFSLQTKSPMWCMLTLVEWTSRNRKSEKPSSFRWHTLSCTSRSDLQQKCNAWFELGLNVRIVPDLLNIVWARVFVLVLNFIHDLCNCCL